MFTNRTERLWVIGAAALGLLIVVIGWFFLISPQQDETSDIEGRTADAQTQNLTLQARINQLTNEKRNRKTYLAALAKAQRALPDRTDMSVFLRDVQSIAAATSTRVSTLNVGEPTAVTPAAAAPTSNPTDASAPAAGSGTFAISIDASVLGRPADLSKFLVRLQTVQPRAVLVTDVTRNSAGSGSAALQITMSVFVAPVAAPATSAPSPGGS